MNLEQIEKRMNEITESIKTAANVDEVKTLSAEYDTLNEQRTVVLNALAKTPVTITKRDNLNPAPVPAAKTEDDPRSTQEYRSAFMKYVKTGRMDAMLAEKRLDATTNTSDITAVIPTTIMDTVIEKLTEYGEIYAMVTKTNMPGGIEFPTASVKPTASWVAEGSVADKQKKTITGKVSFSYYKLQIRVAVTLEASLVSLAAFERVLAQNLAEAIVTAIEDAIIEGSGAGQPLGILNDTGIPAGQIVDFVSTDATWAGWKTKLFGKMPLAYRRRKTPVIICAPGTWDKYIDGMVDDTKQPLARVSSGINGAEVLRFNGRLVILTEKLPSLDDAAASEKYLIYGDLSDYVLNTTMSLTYRKYFDEDLDEWVQKLTLIADGKLLDKNGFVILKKPAA